MQVESSSKPMLAVDEVEQIQEFVALTTRQLDYLARQDPYLEPIFKGVFASDQIPKEKDIQTRSAYIVNVDTHDKQGSHWLSIFVEKDQCEVFTVMDYHSIGIYPPLL